MVALDPQLSARGPDQPAEDPVRETVLGVRDDRPHTRRELREAVDADPIDELLETLRADGTVTRAGSGFGLDRSA